MKLHSTFETLDSIHRDAAFVKLSMDACLLSRLLCLLIVRMSLETLRKRDVGVIDFSTWGGGKFVSGSLQLNVV
jgi:hypothetical protein